jgi:hypothetical protein
VNCVSQRASQADRCASPAAGKNRSRLRTTEPVAAVISEAMMISALERGRTVMEQRIEGALPLASIDKVQIQQVLVNLMRNALEAMAECEERVLTIAAHSTERRLIEISVADTGPGLPKDVANRLFQPFVTTKAGGMVFHFTILVVAEQGQAGDQAVVTPHEPVPGSNLRARAMMRIPGQHAIAISNSNHLTGNFNVHLRDCLFLFVDEVFLPRTARTLAS